MKTGTLQRVAAVAALGIAALAAQAAPVVVDVAGAHSVNLLGEAGNTVWLVDVGAGAVLNAIAWDVSLNALDPSLLGEMLVSFGDSAGVDLASLAVAGSDSRAGAGSYAGSLDLSPLGLRVGSDGMLRIEFSEAYKDFAQDTSEGAWLSGMLSFDVSVAAVPEPAGMALVVAGMALLGAQRRHRSCG